MTNRFKGIIFDFNGVLWWDSFLQEKVYKEFSRKLRGTPLTDEEMNLHVHGTPNKNNIEYILGCSISTEEADRLTQEKESIYRNLCVSQKTEFKLSPGAEDLLNYLAEHTIPRTICTSSEKTNVDFFFEHLNLSTWFDRKKVVLDDGTILGKPAPDMYLRAAKNINLEPKDCIVIEDAVLGIQAAHAAGIGKIIALGPVERHETLRQLPGVSEVITSLEEFDKTLFN